MEGHLRDQNKPKNSTVSYKYSLHGTKSMQVALAAI